MKTVRSLETHPELFQSVLMDVLGSGNYAEGKYCQQVKGQFQELTGKDTVLTNSCGSSLFMVYKWLAERGHQKVLIQNNTFYATGACAAEAGMQVLLIDSRVDCPSMSVDSLIEAHKKTGATVVTLTHIGGWLAKDYDQIASYCRQNKLFLLEDCAHAVGLEKAGKYGDAAVWSFYPTKAVPSGEGGAVTSEVPELMDFVQDYVQYGKQVINGRMTYGRGMNFRMSEWDAAILSVQLARLPEILASRRADAERLQSVARCLLSGESNFYKYLVRSEDAVGMKTVGKVYAQTDQLDHAMNVYKPVVATGLMNSKMWADGHACLPVGEDLFKDMTEVEIRAALKK